MNKEDIDFLISIQDLEQPDFDNACLERENNRLNKEIDRLNNIISELEKWLNENVCLYSSNDLFPSDDLFLRKERPLYEALNKLRELKEKE